MLRTNAERRQLPWRRRQALRTHQVTDTPKQVSSPPGPWSARPEGLASRLSEGVIRHLELLIAACGVILALATAVTSYMQYRVATIQTAIAEATLSPQLVVTTSNDEGPLNPKRGIEITNDGGGPATNISLQLSSSAKLYSMDASTLPPTVIYRSIPIDGLWTKPQILSGSAHQSIASLQLNPSGFNALCYLASRLMNLSVFRDGGPGNLIGIDSALEVSYSTPLGLRRTDHFKISDRVVTKVPSDDQEFQAIKGLRSSQQFKQGPFLLSYLPQPFDRERDIWSDIDLRLQEHFSLPPPSRQSFEAMLKSNQRPPEPCSND